MIEELKEHLNLGNYAVFKEFAEKGKSHEVANLLKETVRYLLDPVIPFSHYEKFRDLPR